MRWVSFSPRMVKVFFFICLFVCYYLPLILSASFFWWRSVRSPLRNLFFWLVHTVHLGLHSWPTQLKSDISVQCDFAFIMNKIRQIFMRLRCICIFLSVGCQFISSVRFPLGTFLVSQPLYAVRGCICLFGVPSWIEYLLAHWLFPLIQGFFSQQKIFTFQWKTFSI